MLETFINVVSDIILKPCTRVTYKTQTAAKKQPSENMAIIDLEFVQPPTINVREEYLIYDTVAMISAIGGTMGLCIGILFYNIMGTGLNWLQFWVNWQKKQNKECQKIFERTNSIAPSNISSLADMKKELIQELSKEMLKETKRDLSILKAEVDNLKKGLQQIKRQLIIETR